MAIAVNGGHVARALDFYRSTGKYFIIGGTTPWEDETTPPPPNPSDFKLNDIIGLKKVDQTHLVIPDPDGTIHYRDQNWKIVPESITTSVGSSGITSGATTISVLSVAGMTVGSKVRVANTYEGTITRISGSLLTLNVPAPSNILSGSPVIGGAMIEGAKYVYVLSYLSYDQFPLATYRQIGLCTGVTPDANTLLASAYAAGSSDEFTSLGTLEVLDNRIASTRDSSQQEALSLIMEF